MNTQRTEVYVVFEAACVRQMNEAQDQLLRDIALAVEGAAVNMLLSLLYVMIFLAFAVITLLLLLFECHY